MAKLEFSPRFVSTIATWPILPLVTVLVCLALTYVVSDSSWLKERIFERHKEAFTLERSLHGLWLAKTIVPAALAISLSIFLCIRRQLAKDRGCNWDRQYASLTVLVTISLLFHLWQCPVALDDAYVDYRYVLHWLTGQFDYNPGERVMGFTSHLHLIMLWVICSLFQTRAVDMVSYYLTCAADTASTILLFYVVLKVYGRILPAFVSVLWFVCNVYYGGLDIIAGKETALVNLFILLSLWSLKTSRWANLSWCANALFLLRPEGILAFLIILATALKTRGRIAWKSFILPCALTGAWYVFLFLYFGTIIPHGMIAKHKAVMAGQCFYAALLYPEVIGYQLNNLLSSLILTAGSAWTSVACVLLVFIYAWLRFKEPCWVLYRNIALAQLLFLLITRPHPFSWYYCWFTLLGPILMAQLTAVAWPVARVDKPRLLLVLRPTICFLVVVYVGVGLFCVPFVWISYIQRGIFYREAAMYLMEKTHGKEAIAAADVGILGYTYSGQIIDLLGLVSDETLKFYPVKTPLGPTPCRSEIEAQVRLKCYPINQPITVPWIFISPEAISAIKPKYLLAPIGQCEGMLLDDADFKRNYTEIKRWTNPNMFGRVVCIWERKAGEDQNHGVRP